MQVPTKNKVEEENFFSELFARYIPYWPLFLVSFLVFFTLALLYLRYATPKYEITATILVKDEKKGVDDSNLMEQLDLFGSKKLVENEIEIIQSRGLIKNVVNNLNLYAPITYEGKIKSTSAYLYSPVILKIKNTDTLDEIKKIYFTYDSANQLVILNGNKYRLSTWYNWPDTLGVFEFLPNPNYRRPGKMKPMFLSVTDVSSVVDQIIDRLKISQATKLSSVIDIKFKDDIPKKGEDIINELISEYNKASLDDKNALAFNTLKFVNERLRLVAMELDTVEQNVQQFKTKEGIINISAQGEQYLENASLNDQKLSEINVQLAVMDQVEKYVESKSTNTSLVPSTFGIDDPILTSLLSKLYDLEIQYESLRKTTSENNPILLSLTSAIEKIKPNILENVQNQKKNLIAGKNNLTETSSKYNSILTKIPKKEQKLIQISRQQEIKNSIYAFLLQKREETALSYNSTIADTRIIDQAETSSKPVSPNRPLIYLGSLALSLVFGACFISFKEVLSPHIVFRQDIEKNTNIPIIGEIGFDDSKSQISIELGKRSYIAEQFRQLRTSLVYTGVNKNNKIILVTSSISGEGKSYITANLGMSLALTDKKVVLIELDLRKPKLSKIFNLSRKVGISNFLVSNAEYGEIIKSTDVNENLFVIPSGTIPPNPSELLLNGRLEILLKYLEANFDFIIIDTSPIMPVTDAYLISPLCSLTLFVVRHGVSLKKSIKLLDKDQVGRNLKNLFLVFNGIKDRGVFSTDHSYGYGNSNGNGYYDEESKKSNILQKLFKAKLK